MKINSFENFIIRESFNKDDLISYFLRLTDDGFEVSFEEYPFSTVSTEGNLFIRIWKPINRSDKSYSYENSANFDWSEIEDEVTRSISMSDNSTLQIKYMYTIENSFTSSGYERAFWKKNDIDNGLSVGRVKCFAMSVVI